VTASSAARWGAAGLVASGVAWTALGAGALSGLLEAIPGRVDVVLFVVAHLLAAVGLLGLHGAQGGAAGGLGRLGLSVTLLALAVRAAVGIAFLAGSPALERASVPATVAMLVGLVLYGIAVFRAGVLPRWYGVALAAAMPVSFPLGSYGTTLFGLSLVALGVALILLPGGEDRQAPPRVR
jgi:hypothetical protein